MSPIEASNSLHYFISSYLNFALLKDAQNDPQDQDGPSYDPTQQETACKIIHTLFA
jgi:hypothetical protein